LSQFESKADALSWFAELSSSLLGYGMQDGFSRTSWEQLEDKGSILRSHVLKNTVIYFLSVKTMDFSQLMYSLSSPRYIGATNYNVKGSIASAPRNFFFV
jgi:hypothetical protein